MLTAKTIATRSIILTEAEKLALISVLLFSAIGLLISVATIVMDQQIPGDWY